MKKGFKVLIVVVVAAATNFGLHAAFWANGNGHCGPQHSNHHGYYQQGGCSNHNTNCANPWGCGGGNSSTPTDTIK